jgi:hypothetical protein
MVSRDLMLVALVLILPCEVCAGEMQVATQPDATHIQPVAEEQHPVLAEFCTLYVEAAQAMSNEDRLSVAERIRSTPLSKDQTDWLMFTLITPDEMSLDECKIIVGKTSSELPRGPLGHVIVTAIYSPELLVTGQARRDYQRTLPLSPREKGMLKSMGVDEYPWLPSVVTMVHLTLCKSGSEENQTLKSPEPQSPKAEPGQGLPSILPEQDAGEEIPGDLVTFCELYQKCHGATDDAAKITLSQAVIASGLGDNEIAWLLYTLLEPGAEVKDAVVIRGTDAALEEHSNGIAFEVDNGQSTVSSIHLSAVKPTKTP